MLQQAPPVSTTSRLSMVRRPPPLQGEPELLSSFDPRLVLSDSGWSAGSHRFRRGTPRSPGVCVYCWRLDRPVCKAADDYFPDWVHNARLGGRGMHEPKRLTKPLHGGGSGLHCSLAELIRRLEAMGTFDSRLVVEKASQA